MATIDRQSSHPMKHPVNHGCLSHWDAFFHWVFQQEQRAERAGDMAFPIRFKVAQHVGFPGHPIDRIEVDEQGTTAWVNIMGLTGAMGALPQPFTATLIKRLQNHDTAMADFFDVFNHRLIVLFYRAWKKNRLSVQSQRDLNSGITQWIQSLVGQDWRDHSSLPRYYAGHFSRKIHSAKQLEVLLRDALQCPVRVESWVGQWLPIPEAHCVQLGDSPHRLGQNALLGQQQWDANHTIAVHIGPMPYHRYVRYLPEGDRYPLLHTAIQRFVPLHIETQVHLSADDTLSAYPRLGQDMQLERGAWLQQESTRLNSVLPLSKVKANPTKKEHNRGTPTSVPAAMTELCM